HRAGGNLEPERLQSLGTAAPGVGRAEAGPPSGATVGRRARAHARGRPGSTGRLRAAGARTRTTGRPAAPPTAVSPEGAGGAPRGPVAARSVIVVAGRKACCIQYRDHFFDVFGPTRLQHEIDLDIARRQGCKGALVMHFGD